MKEMITDMDETSHRDSRREGQREERDNFPRLTKDVNPQIWGASTLYPTWGRPLDGQPSVKATCDLGLPLLRAHPTARIGN